MTTLVALATRDSLVMGCDSLGSITKRMVDPFDVIVDFFDSNNEWKLKVDEKGDPILQTFDDIYKKSQDIPFDHMTHMTKLFSLSPLEMGVMTTGIASIGERTLKSIINEFKEIDDAFDKKRKSTNYTVKSISKRLMAFINGFYQKRYKDAPAKPGLELMVGGYDKQKQVPTTYRIFIHKPKISPDIENTFGISFGGQTEEIQRIVFGTDTHNKINLIRRVEHLFEEYLRYLQAFLKEKGINERLPTFRDFDDLNLFKDWGLQEFNSNWGDFSEQNAIECVNFFVEVMIKSQQFSSSLPTVGGEVHIALITKNDGFKFISREEYEHEGHTTSKGE